MAVAQQDPGGKLMAHRVTMARYGIKVGPVGHLAAERERLEALQWQHFDVKRLSATIGAEISRLARNSERPALCRRAGTSIGIP